MISNGLYSELKSLDDNGTPPKTRMSSARDVRSMFTRCRNAYEKRHQKNALVKGLVDGNPPWPNKTKDAQRYRANFNNGEGYAYLETSVTAFYDVYSEPETYATVTADVNDPNSQLYSDIITKHFDWLQRQDDEMDFNIQLSIHDMVYYGTGPQLFLRPLDWRSTAVPHRSLYVSDDERANVASWQWCIFQFDYNVNELWDFIADEEAARISGWNVAEVKRSIMNAKPTSWTSPEWNQWEAWQQALRNNDLYLGSQCAKVRIAKILYKEFSVDGAEPKISEAWVDIDASSDEFLNRFEDRYDDMRQAVCAFYYDRGDGFHQSIKGLGVKMYQLLTSRMRLQLAAVDAAFATSTVFLTSNQPTGRQALSNIQFGAFTVLPNGVSTIQQSNLQGVLEPAIAMGEQLGRVLDNNLSQYRQRMELPSGNPPTKYQVQAQLAQSATLGKTQLARYYQQLDELYAEKFRRASNPDLPKGTKNKWLRLALEFQKKCADDGVPREIFEKCQVKATRIAGQGSQFMREQSLNQIYATLFPALPEDGKERLIRDMISATVGPSLTNRYWTRGQIDPNTADQNWQAEVEHGLLYDGGAVQVTPTQNDVIHLTKHFEWLAQGVQSVQQGGDLAEIFNSLVAGRAHVAQHMARLQQDASRKQEFAQFMELFKSISQSIDEMQQMLEQQAQQQAMQQQQMAQAQVSVDAETMKAQNKIALDQAKAQNMMQIKAAKAQQDMALKDAETAQRLKIAQATTTQDLANQQAQQTQKVNEAAIKNAGLIAKQQIANQKPMIPGQSI